MVVLSSVGTNELGAVTEQWGRKVLRDGLTCCGFSCGQETRWWDVPERRIRRREKNKKLWDQRLTLPAGVRSADLRPERERGGWGHRPQSLGWATFSIQTSADTPQPVFHCSGQSTAARVMFSLYIKPLLLFYYFYRIAESNTDTQANIMKLQLQHLHCSVCVAVLFLVCGFYKCSSSLLLYFVHTVIYRTLL